MLRKALLTNQDLHQPNNFREKVQDQTSPNEETNTT